MEKRIKSSRRERERERDHVKHRARRNTARSELFPEDNPRGQRPGFPRGRSPATSQGTFSASLDVSTFAANRFTIPYLEIRTTNKPCQRITYLPLTWPKLARPVSASPPSFFFRLNDLPSFTLDFCVRNLRSNHLSITPHADLRSENARRSDDRTRFEAGIQGGGRDDLRGSRRRMGARVSRRSSVEHRKREHGRSRGNVRGTRDTEREGLSSRTGSMRALGMRESQGATRRTENADIRRFERQRGLARLVAERESQGVARQGRKREKEEGETAQA